MSPTFSLLMCNSLFSCVWIQVMGIISFSELLHNNKARNCDKPFASMWQVWAAVSSESNLKTYLYKTFNRLVHECLNSCQQFKMILPGGISRTLSVLFLTANTLSQAQLDHLDAHEKQTENITNSSPTKTRKSHDHHFDFLMFTQLWPISNCIDWEERGSGHTCSLNGKSSLSCLSFLCVNKSL